MKTPLAAFATCLPLTLLAQTLKVPEAPPPAPTEFPADAAPLSAAALKEKLAGKVFNVKLHNGDGWRLEYRTNGFFHVNVGSFSSSGPWDTDGSKLCAKLRGQDTACNEIRQSGDTLYLKRTSGEVIALVRQN